MGPYEAHSNSSLFYTFAKGINNNIKEIYGVTYGKGVKQVFFCII